MCRRCSECIDSDHHWLPNGAFGDDSQENNECIYVCKHCNAIGDECGECDGDGCDPYSDDELCAECGGEGIVYVAGGDVVYTKAPPCAG